MANNDKNKKSLPSRYSNEEIKIISDIAQKMGVSPSMYQKLWTMYGVYLCKFLDEDGELTKFLKRGNALTLRSQIHRPFLDECSLPTSTRNMFKSLMEDYATKEGKQLKQ